jgi:hypothetical protein
MNHKTPPVCRWIALVATGVAALSGCGGSKAVGRHSFKDVAHVKIIHNANEVITEEGQLTGAFDVNLILNINLTTGRMSFAASNHEGAFEGVAGVLRYQLSGQVRHFLERGFVTKGTGVFAHDESDVLTFKTVDDKTHDRITVTVTGVLSY